MQRTLGCHIVPFTGLLVGLVCVGCEPAAKPAAKPRTVATLPAEERQPRMRRRRGATTTDAAGVFINDDAARLQSNRLAHGYRGRRRFGGHELPAKVLLGVEELYAGIPGDGPLKLEKVEHWFADPEQQCRLRLSNCRWGFRPERIKWSALPRIPSPGQKSSLAASSISIRGFRPTRR